MKKFMILLFIFVAVMSFCADKNRTIKGKMILFKKFIKKIRFFNDDFNKCQVLPSKKYQRLVIMTPESTYIFKNNIPDDLKLATDKEGNIHLYCFSEEQGFRAYQSQLKRITYFCWLAYFKNNNMIHPLKLEKEFQYYHYKYH